MSSSSSLSSARRRRVGSQQVVQNPPASVREIPGGRMQNVPQERPGARVNNGQPSMNIPPNAVENANGRPAVNPSQLLMQHDYRLFQIEKLVKTIHENTSKEEPLTNNESTRSSGPSTSDSNVNVNFDTKVDMDEIKGAVSESIYTSDKWKAQMQDEARKCIEASYDFDTFFENLQKVSQENQTMKDTLVSNQKYINEMNSVLIKLLSEFRDLQNIIKDFKLPVLETIQEVEELIDTSDDSIKSNEQDKTKEVKNEDSPDEESEEVEITDENK